MKIALLTPSLSNHGPNVFTLNLVKGLIRNGISPEIFYFSSKFGLEFPVKCTRVSFASLKYLKKFDVVHSTMLMPDLLSSIFIKDKGPVVVTGLHNFYREDLSFLYSKIKARILAAAWNSSIARINNAIVSSDQMKVYYKDELKVPANIVTIPYGIDLPTVENDIPAVIEKEISTLRSLGLKIIGSCGLLIKRKGFSDLLHAIAERDDSGLIIVGGGPEFEHLKKLADDLGISKKVVFTGQQSNSAKYYKYFDIFAMTSLSEGFGIAMLEAISLGLPLVCSDLDIYRNFFDNTSVSLFEPGNSGALSTAIDLAWQRRFSQRDASRKIFEANFTLDLMAQRHIKYYMSLLAKDH